MALATVIAITCQRTEHAGPRLVILSANFPSEEADLIVYSDAIANKLAIAGVRETQVLRERALVAKLASMGSISLGCTSVYPEDHEINRCAVARHKPYSGAHPLCILFF